MANVGGILEWSVQSAIPEVGEPRTHYGNGPGFRYVIERCGRGWDASTLVGGNRRMERFNAEGEVAFGAVFRTLKEAKAASEAHAARRGQRQEAGK